MTSSRQKKRNHRKNRKNVYFHRDWTRLLSKREQRIQYRLRNNCLNERNETQSVIESTNDDEVECIVSFKDQLRSWTVDNKISMNGLDELLRILRSNGHTELPKSYRSLLNTPRNIEIKTFGDSKYWYRGIAACLKIILCKLDRDLEVKLKFNIDGLPIFNSSQLEFWPLLASIDGMPSVKPMVIGIWYGRGKPILNEFLGPFVDELNYILTNGIKINAFDLKVSILYFICDSPARAFLKGTVNFNHREGCQKCEVVGRYFKRLRRMSFIHSNCALRNDQSFRQRIHPNHHKTFSIIEKLPIDMVRDFVVADPLHLLELGVLKTLILKWSKGAIGYDGKWSVNQKSEVSALLLKTNSELPSEIHRAVRALKDIAFWKGTEYRTVLLYIGMVAFKNHLEPEIYNHFLLLSSAVTICSCDEYKSFLPKAREMFLEFIEDQIHLYGLHSVPSNFHNLLHIVDDVERFGNLNKISAYEFENCLGTIKSRVKLFNKPLEQIARRLIEIGYLNREAVNFDTTFKPSVKYVHQISHDTTRIAFKEISIRPNVLLSNRKFGDRWFLTTDKQIVEMQYTFLQNGEHYICGIPIIDKSDFFTYPFSSRHINIFQSKMTKGTISNFSIIDYKVKLLCLSFMEHYVFIPLLHSF